MSKLREKAQGRTKKAFGQMIGDDELVREGKEQEKHAEREGEPKNGDTDRASNRGQEEQIRAQAFERDNPFRRRK